MTATPEEVRSAMIRAIDLCPYNSGEARLDTALRAARDLRWKLVPESLTPEMRNAMFGATAEDQHPAAVWLAALAAAPDLLEEK